MQGGQGRFRFLPLGPPAPPVTPLKRSLREGVRHCTPSLYCTKRRHRETGDSSRARPVGDAARGESGGIGSIASGSAARRPYSNQRCGFRVSESRRGYKAAHCSLFISTPQSHFVRQLPGRGAFWAYNLLLSRPWHQLPRSFAKIAQHKHEHSCYEQPQRGKACEQAHLCICAERKFNFHLSAFGQVCAES